MNDANDDISEYEKLRLKKIEENRKCLLELGLGSRGSTPKSPRKEQRSNTTPKSARKRRQSTATPEPVRRITRRSVQLGEQYQHEQIEADEDEEAPPPSKKKEYRENFFGAVPGTKVGDSWEYRLDCSIVGVHRPTVAGIHGGPDGAYSIALSGGYEDDIDYGDHFTYTGAGGRDLKGTKTNPKNLRTAPQSKDQTADGPNASLIASVKTKNPVRVIRGYKLNSLYAPESGYRYDGLYTVDKYWTERGIAGFLVYKFHLSRIKDQELPIWEQEINQENSKQHINCQRTPSKLNLSSPEHKNSDLKIKTPKKSPQVNSRVSSPLNQNNHNLNSLPSRKSPSKVSPAMTPEKEAKSPTKVSFESQNGMTPSKAPNTPSKVALVPSKDSASPLKSTNSPTKVTESPLKVLTSPSKVLTSPLKIPTSSSKVSTLPPKVSNSPLEVPTSPSKKVATSPSKVFVSPLKVLTSPFKLVSPSKVVTSPLKITSQSEVATSPSKITSPSKVLTCVTKVSPNKYILSKQVPTSPFKSNQPIPANGKTPPGKKVMFVTVKSPSAISLIKDNADVCNLYGAVNGNKTPTKNSVSNGFSHSLRSVNNDAKNVCSPSSSSSKVVGKTVELLKVNGLKSPTSKNELVDKSNSSNKVDSHKISASSPSKLSSPSKHTNQNEATPSKKVTEPIQSKSPGKASQEKKEAKVTSGVSPIRCQLTRAVKVSSPLKHSSLKPKEATPSKKVSESIKSESAKKASQERKEANVTSPTRCQLSRAVKVSSPTKHSSQKETTPSLKATEPTQSESSIKTSQEKKEAKSKPGVSPARCELSRAVKDKVSLKRDLFNGSSSSVLSSPKSASRTPNKRATRSSPFASPENSPKVKRTRGNDLSSESSNKTSESPRTLRKAAPKQSPQTVPKPDDSFKSSKSPPTTEQKKAKPVNTLERYFVKKFASNDYARLNRYKFSPVKYNNDSDDESTPAFIGFNEITINNARNRLKLLTDFFPSILRKQSIKTKLNYFKKSKKTEELTKCSSTKREYTLSIDKIRDLSFKISNMSNFDPNAGFIPECFVKCSKIDSSETSSSDEGKLPEKEPKNVFLFGESSAACSSPSSCVPKKGLSPQKLLDLVSSDEENDDEPFLGFKDVSTRSIVRNGFLIQKYAKIFNKN